MFKVGDKVLVTEKLRDHEFRNARFLCGKICTVSKVDDKFCHLEEETYSGAGGVWLNEITLIDILFLAELGD